LARLVLGPDAAHDEVVEASLAGERVFHGQPSGIDSHVAASGGVLAFTRGETPTPVRLREPLRLVVIPSKVPRSTADQVAKVRDKLERLPSLTRPALECLGAAVREGQSALERADLPRLGEIMNMTHEVLSALDVSSRVLDELCAIARDQGALGAKLTGAGGGGCVIALPPAGAPPSGLDSLEPLTARGLDPFCVEVSP
jgi:mevalonate kinase